MSAKIVTVQIPMEQELYGKLVVMKTTKRSWAKFLEDELLQMSTPPDMYYKLLALKTTRQTWYEFLKPKLQELIDEDTAQKIKNKQILPEPKEEKVDW